MSRAARRPNSSPTPSLPIARRPPAGGDERRPGVLNIVSWRALVSLGIMFLVAGCDLNQTPTPAPPTVPTAAPVLLAPTATIPPPAPTPAACATIRCVAQPAAPGRRDRHHDEARCLAPVTRPAG